MKPFSESSPGGLLRNRVENISPFEHGQIALQPRALSRQDIGQNNPVYTVHAMH
jgi:hypothetical protein